LRQEGGPGDRPFCLHLVLSARSVAMASAMAAIVGESGMAGSSLSGLSH
jgi:hypothetical protein